MVARRDRADPATTMELLWTSGTERSGRTTRLQVDDIVVAAIDLADTGGLDAVSMRAVARALEVTAMALYTYVPSKSALVELMVDRVVGEQSLPQLGDDWRSSLDAHARESVALYRRHPWLLDAATSRTVFGPNVITQFDAALGALAGTRLSGTDRVRTISAVATYTRGAATAIVEAERAAVRTGQSDDEWWAARSPLLDERLQRVSFPHIEEAASHGAFEPSDESAPYTQARAINDFEFGLEALLDGIASLVAGSGSSAT